MQASWSFVAQFSNAGSGSGKYLIGGRTGAFDYNIRPDMGSNTRSWCSQTACSNAVPAVTTGNMGTAGNTTYLNGSAGSTVAGYGTVSSLTIGKFFSGFFSGSIQGLAIYDSTLSAPEMSALVTRMGALGTSVTRDTTIKHSGAASAKVVAADNYNFIQSQNVGDTNTYNLVAYAYTNGSEVTSSDAELYYNGSTITTTITPVDSNWYKLSATITGANAARDYGVQVKANKTVYLDDLSLNRYASTGTLTSSIFDTGQRSNWGILTYAATIPANTAASVKVRTSNDSGMAGATDFTSCTAITSGSDISGTSCATDNQRYVQYQINLSSTDISNTSTFTSFSLPFAVALQPADPTTLQQYKSDQSTIISTGGSTNETPIVIKFTMSSGTSSDSLTPEVEIREIGTAFTNTVTNSGSAVVYTGSPVTGVVTMTGLVQGNYHWQVRVTNSSGSSNWVSYGGNSESETDVRIQISSYTTTFAAGMAKRSGNIFASGLTLQGSNGGAADVVSFPRGSQISGNWYANFDANQGWITMWIRPEWNGNDNINHYLLNFSSNGFLRKNSSNQWEFSLASGASMTADASSIVAGTTYRLEFRWDSRNSLDGAGGHYAAISIDDTHNLGITSTWTPETPFSSINVGSDSSANNSASAIIQGLIIYRRPGWDGSNGINAGNGDEVASNTDKTLTTGSWDVVMSLPTDQDTGALAGTLQAWTHPHSSNLLTTTDGFMLSGTAWNNWTDVGTPGGKALLDSSEKIYSGGYKFTSGSANTGVAYQLSGLTAGTNYVLHWVAHESGGAKARIRVWDVTNNAAITTFDSSGGYTRTTPWESYITFELPTTARNGVATDSTSIQIQILESTGTGTVYAHQIELLSNGVDNPSLETPNASDPWAPDGWTVGTSVAAGETSRETSLQRSGSAALRFNPSCVNCGNFHSSAGSASNHTYTSEGGALKNSSDSTNYVGWQSAPSGIWRAENTATTNLNRSNTSTSWSTIFGVARIDYPDDIPQAMGVAINTANTSGGSTRWADDLYYFVTIPVTLTVTPASEANSIENTNEVRVDGRDAYYISNASFLNTTSGNLIFDYRPKHSSANAVKFSETTAADAYILYLYGDANNYIKVFWDSANTIKMEYDMNGGGAVSSTKDATGLITANTKYSTELAYTGGGNMIFSVGGTPYITLNNIPAAFGTVANNIYFGSYFDGTNATLQSDASYSTIVSDTTPPAISITALSPDPNSSSSPTISGTATDDYGTINNIQYQMDSTSGAWTNCTATDGTFNSTTEAFSCSVSPSLSDGSHTIYIRSTDSNGNTTSNANASTDSFVIDTAVPTIPGTPSTTSASNNTKPTWTWAASTDSGSGLATPPYTLQWSKDSSFASGVSSDTSTTNSFTHSSSLPDGTWYFRVKASDASGNYSAYSTSGSDTINTVTSSDSSSSSSNNNSTTSTPNCGDQAPGTKAPWLYGAIAQDSGSVLLYFTEADNPVNKYVLEYGTKSGDYPYGVQDMGINLRGQMTFLVKSLSSNTTYYFRVRGGNGCATGTWSNEISAKTKGLVSFNQLEITQSELEAQPATKTQANSCQTYTVKPGDTLWSIAKNLLGDGNKYKDIIEQNKDTYSSLETSNNLRTGWELKINCGKQAVTEETKKSTETRGGYVVKVKVIDTNKKPIEGASVTLHSTPQTAKTNNAGIAEFKNVEAGDHKVLIAYNNFEGEQSINLTGDVKEFDLNVTVQQKAISLSPLAYGIIGIMGLIIIGLIVLLIKNKRKE